MPIIAMDAFQLIKPACESSHLAIVEALVYATALPPCGGYRRGRPQRSRSTLKSVITVMMIARNVFHRCDTPFMVNYYPAVGRWRIVPHTEQILIFL